jgi:hypothetical protein
MEGLMAQKTWKRFPSRYLTVLLAIQTASCGTVLYPERRGQPAGRIDPGVVALDAVGLLLFFIPGIIAFAVDFSDGTIYLPPDVTAFSCPANGKRLQTVQVNPAELTSHRLEAVLQEHTGQPIQLQAGTYLVAKVDDIRDFTAATLDSMRSAPFPSYVAFRATSE